MTFGQFTKSRSLLYPQVDDDYVPDSPSSPDDGAASDKEYYSDLFDEPLYQVYHRDAVAREIVHQSGTAEVGRVSRDPNGMFELIMIS